jgi:hypothetical protein
MKLAANAYAIGPSLYDSERDRWEEQEIRRDARDAAFDDHFDLWRRFAYCDREKKKGIEEIADVMDTALNNLYCNDKDCAKFEFALFVWYCSDSNPDARNVMNELLDKHIRAVIRKEWGREQEAA